MVIEEEPLEVNGGGVTIPIESFIHVSILKTNLLLLRLRKCFNVCLITLIGF